MVHLQTDSGRCRCTNLKWGEIKCFYDVFFLTRRALCSYYKQGNLGAEDEVKENPHTLVFDSNRSVDERPLVKFTVNQCYPCKLPGVPIAAGTLQPSIVKHLHDQGFMSTKPQTTRQRNRNKFGNDSSCVSNYWMIGDMWHGVLLMITDHEKCVVLRYLIHQSTPPLYNSDLAHSIKHLSVFKSAKSCGTGERW